MFSIGIEFSIPELLKVKWVALVGAPIGILLSIGLGAGVGMLLGWPLPQGVAVGCIISVASTMVLMRLLMDRGELSSEAGRVMITPHARRRSRSGYPHGSATQLLVPPVERTMVMFYGRSGKLCFCSFPLSSPAGRSFHACSLE